MFSLAIFLSGFNPAAQLGSILLGLLIFIGILVAAWFTLKLSTNGGQRLGRGMLGKVSGGQQTQMQVLERLALSPTVSLLVVRVGDRVFLLSCGKESADFLSELQPGDVAADGRASVQNGSTTSFWTRFWHNLLYNMGFRAEKDLPPPKQSPVPAEETASISTGILEEALRKIAEAQTAEPTPTPLSNLDEGSGQSRISTVPETPRRNAIDYNAALASMRQNAQIGERRPGDNIPAEPVRPAQQTVLQQAPLSVDTISRAPAETVVTQTVVPQVNAAGGTSDGAPPSGSFAEALSQAQQPRDDSSARASDAPVRTADTSDIPSGDLRLTKPADAAPAAEDDLDALFDKIAQRRERMSNRERKG